MVDDTNVTPSDMDEFFARVEGGVDKPSDDDVRQQVRRQVQLIVERIKTRTLTPK